MKISDLARRTGVSTKAIRFYEAEGLLPQPPRTPSGYRLYGDKDVARLEFIADAKQAGLSLQEAREILQLYHQRQDPCGHVRALLGEKLATVDQALRDLEGLREELLRLKARADVSVDCHPSQGRICGIIEAAE